MGGALRLALGSPADRAQMMLNVIPLLENMVYTGSVQYSNSEQPNFPSFLCISLLQVIQNIVACKASLCNVRVQSFQGQESL